MSNVHKDDLIDLQLITRNFNCDLIEFQNEQSKLGDASYTDFSRRARNLEFEECPDNKEKEIFQKKYIGPQLDLETNNRKCLGNLIICASLIGKF